MAISNLDELDASLSSVSEKSDAIRSGMKAAEQRMKELQKLIPSAKRPVSLFPALSSNSKRFARNAEFRWNRRSQHRNSLSRTPKNSTW